MLQVLLTGYDFEAPEGHANTNFLHTMNCLLNMKVIPVLNGNDVHSPPPQRNSDLKDVRSSAWQTVSLSHGAHCSSLPQQVVSIPDNDHLSALVANSMEADLLVLLSDVDGGSVASLWLS